MENNIFKYQNWKKNIPSNFFEYINTPVSRKLRIVNMIFQKILRLNSETKFMVNYTSTVTHPELINIGKDVCISVATSGGCYYAGANGINIGDMTLIAPGVKIVSASHRVDDLKVHDKTKPIQIGKRCWLGANAVILPGVALGDGSIVAAGAVVTKSYPEGKVVLAGVPAEIVRII